MLDFVYDLIDPRDDLPFYVGITNDPNERMMQHLLRDDSNKGKVARINDIQTAGLTPKMHIIEVVESRDIAHARETYWIQDYLAKGYKLTNIQKIVNSITAHDDKFTDQTRNYGARKYVLEWDYVETQTWFPLIRYAGTDNIIKALNYGWETFQHDPATYIQHPRGKSFRDQTWDVYLNRFCTWVIERNPDKADIISTWKEGKNEKLTAMLINHQSPLETTAYDLYKLLRTPYYGGLPMVLS